MKGTKKKGDDHGNDESCMFMSRSFPLWRRCLFMEFAQAMKACKHSFLHSYRSQCIMIIIKNIIDHTTKSDNQIESLSKENNAQSQSERGSIG